jgi:gas vesicle protein
MSNMKVINGIFLSFLLGGAIGGTLALLYAPQKGKYLRKDISRKANGLIKEGKKITYDSWNDAKEKAENIIESANDALSTNVEKIVRKTEKLKDALKSGLNV